MATTIAVNDRTLEMLRYMKEETKSVTYDETIRKLVLEMKKPKESWLGAMKDLGPFKREEMDRFETKWKKRH